MNADAIGLDGFIFPVVPGAAFDLDGFVFAPAVPSGPPVGPGRVVRSKIVTGAVRRSAVVQAGVARSRIVVEPRPASVVG